ncbi:F0F1 ATP synthase subunit epsilon [Acholeplasma laidlawii]|uniref:F0F1 ATP synthase subunit epsilon n=1 Tax=Acholeplasma laidlawii TaxID=2148 RepID=UPI00084CDFE1|nr:hypothetical protein [Acholeplasma laidlawii]OED59312.1 hypothetical protein BHS12_04255 [Acholeplasma laidlawii]
MKLEVIGQQGIKYQETIDYAVILKKEGEFAILDKHVQTLTTVHNEFIKLVQNDLVFYLYVQSGAVVYKNRLLRIFAMSAELARSKEDAVKLVTRIEKEASEKAKKQNVDYSQLEKELREQITKAKAGHI